jgi:hypothetical protein
MVNGRWEMEDGRESDEWIWVLVKLLAGQSGRRSSIARIGIIAACMCGQNEGLTG